MFTRILAVTAFACFMLAHTPAHAGDGDKSFPQWVGHHLLGIFETVTNPKTSQKLEAHRYLNYEHREPCQNYRQVPEGYTKTGCSIRVAGQEKVSASKKTRPEMGQVFRTYTVYFGFDSAELTQSARTLIAKVANEIDQFQPENVTVAGYTDTSGPAEYNKRLSDRRAETVSQALAEFDVQNKIINKKAFGEDNLAVKTQDGTRLSENRRVVIEFRK